ncbi:isochorismate synthase [Demequina pelophila]|uniref:isochorismate synthase n=1 Tax=Demequina pelophila TaxID=1638984 RepID=UPI000B3320AB|nr:isochorismate synthase [Demequina pelophila]
MTVHTTHPGPLLARTVEIDDPGDLLAALPEPGIAWVRRGEGMVAWGEVARVDTVGPDRIDEAQHWWLRLTRHAVVRDDVRLRGTGLVAFGSFAFSDSSASGGSLVVPRYVLGRRDGISWFTAIGRGDDEAVTVDDALAQRSAPEAPGRVAIGGGDRSAWTEAVAGAVERIRAGALEKVVIARSVSAEAERPVDPRWVTARLADDYPTCWTFHVDGLVGATPELLARVDHGLVTSRVLAGTIRMTGDDMRDLAHAGALARSSKDREEHEYAVRSVTQAMASHCGSVNVPDEPFVLHLPNVMHLATDVTGVLSHNVAALELVRELHPSAAVCGTPTLEAAAAIDELEGLDRGRYAGPVGWIDEAGDGEWCIGLRSAAIDPEDARLLTLYAGCGIVSASEPAAEWAESEAKLEPMRRALGGTTPTPAVGWDEAEWEERYRSREAVWSANPNAQLVDEVAALAPGRALDAGCGEGTDAVWLATQGWHVTAVDISPTAIDRGRERALRAGVDEHVRWIVGDALDPSLAGSEYDLVSAQFAHPMAGIASLVATLAAKVAPGGTLLVVGHDPRDPHTHDHPRLQHTAFRAEEAAAALGVDAWKIEVAEMREHEARTPDGGTRLRRDAVLRAHRRD